MFKYVQKYMLLLLVSLYFVVRLPNLTAIPLFNDEAIYLDWGWRELHKGVLFYSLLDAKQPLVLWLFGGMQGIVSDQVFAGRSVSVLTGLVSCLGIYFLGKEIFTKKIGVLAAVVYILNPYFSFFDRQALFESALVATEIWVIVFFVRLTKKVSWKSVLLLGVAIGIGIFIKTSFVLLLFSLLCIVMVSLIKGKQTQYFIRGIVGAFCIAQIIAMPLYLQPLFWQTLSTNSRYSYTFSDLLHFPFVQWFQNGSALLQIGFLHLTPFLFLSAVWGIVLCMKKGSVRERGVVIVFLFQFVTLIFIAKNINPRYAVSVYFLAPLFVAVSIVHLTRWRYLFVPLVFFIPCYFLFLQIFLPELYFHQLQRLTAYSQRESYLTNDTAGSASSQAIKYLLSTRVPVAIVAVRLDTGNPENAAFTYFHRSTTRIPTYLEARIIANVQQYDCLTYTVPVYFLSRNNQLAGLERFLVEEKRFYNEGNVSSVGVYHFKYPCLGRTLNLAAPGAILQPKR